MFLWPLSRAYNTPPVSTYSMHIVCRYCTGPKWPTYNGNRSMCQQQTRVSMKIHSLESHYRIIDTICRNVAWWLLLGPYCGTLVSKTSDNSLLQTWRQGVGLNPGSETPWPQCRAWLPSLNRFDSCWWLGTLSLFSINTDQQQEYCWVSSSCF